METQPLSQGALTVKNTIVKAMSELGQHLLSLLTGFYTPLRESVQAITQKHALNADWFDYLAQMLMYDEVIVPDGKLWKRFGPLHVYAPPREYMLALKIAAGREKDLDDCAILLAKTKIRTREQAQQLVERYILPKGQENNAESIENSLYWLFERASGVDHEI